MSFTCIDDTTILEPSKDIDEKFQSYTFILDSGKTVTGMITAEDANTVSVVVDPLAKDLRDMQNAIKDGSYEFADNDLPFMPIVQSQSNLNLPFKPVLRMINETHRKGLQTEEEA